jgi:RRXRR protein
VFALDGRKKPLMPCSERRARPPLERGRAMIHKRCPFTIRIKIDPGSKYTGIAVTREEDGMKGSGHGLR